MIPSVTQVLGCFSDFSMIPPGVLEYASYRGTEIHKICSAMALGLWINEIPEEFAGYILSFQAWFERTVKEVLFVEEELVDPVYGFMGHPDLVIKTHDNVICLPDLKTPVKAMKVWKGQVAAYKHLVETNKKDIKIERVGSLMLSPKGNYPKFNEYQTTYADFAAFLAALSAYRYFKE